MVFTQNQGGRAMSAPVTIGIIGDYNPDFESHRATGTAIQLAAKAAGVVAAVTWVPTPEVNASPEILQPYDGLWGGSGSPYKSFDGMLAGIRFARERGKPFVAT